jgi:thiol-disulfide isomerase/thioredoxin
MMTARFLRPLVAFLPLFFAPRAAPAISASEVWSDLQAKRAALPGWRQEFEVSQTTRSANHTQSSKRKVILDVSGSRWREASVSGSGTFVRIFDGADILSMQDGEDEFMRTRHRSKDGDPLPSPYAYLDPVWAKAAVELSRRPCGIPGNDHTCVVLEAPLKPWSHAGTSINTIVRMLHGSARALLDTETGLLLSLHATQLIEDPRGNRQSESSFAVLSASYGTPPETSLFNLPTTGMREVKEPTRWSAARLKKQLAGKPAPPLEVTDLQGNPVSLSALKGKTVLLDFWTTWCPPCRADAPALDKLYRKYHQNDLMIIGVSVSEEHDVVETFLKEHPHSFPIVLTTENDMPRPYQVSAFPTYIVIGRDGTVVSAVEGEKGFGELRDLLKKAGLELD